MFPLIEADLYRTESGAISPILVQPALVPDRVRKNRQPRLTFIIQRSIRAADI